MMDRLDFSVWAPDEATFWQSWIDAGIVEMVDGERQYTSEYPGISTTTSWHGLIVKEPAVLDSNDDVITDAVLVPGWHTNVHVTGPLVLEMTHGIDQHDDNGDLKSVLDRTWAPVIFSLTEQAADPATGFPAGYRNADGVTYTDSRSFSSPSNVLA